MLAGAAADSLKYYASTAGQLDRGAMMKAIRDFLEKAKGKEVFTDFDGIMRGMQEQLPAREGGSPAVEIAWQLYELARDHLYVMLVIERKLVQIAKGLESSYADDNISVFLNLSRSFVEHVASLCYQSDLLRKCLDELPKKQDDTSMRASIATHHEALRRLFYNTGKKGSKGQTSEAVDDDKMVHVNNMLAVVKKVDRELFARYDDLCEFVHPNYGSNKIVSSGNLGKGPLVVPRDVFETERGEAVETLRGYVALADKTAIDIARFLISLQSRMSIASQIGTKVGQIFSDRVNHVGDGKSRETALFFEKARTHDEERTALFAYMKKSGLELQSRMMAGIEGGFLIDAIQTNKGTLWVKHKIR